MNHENGTIKTKIKNLRKGYEIFFGKAIFESSKADYISMYKEILNLYCSKSCISSQSWNNDDKVDSIEELKIMYHRCRDISLEEPEVITEIDTESKFCAKLDGESKSESNDLPGYYNITLSACIELLAEDASFIDLMAESLIIAESTIIEEYEILENDKLSKEQLEKFRKNGKNVKSRRKEPIEVVQKKEVTISRNNKRIKAEERTFSDMGYVFPVDTKIRSSKGRGYKYEIIKVAPDFFRCIILKDEFKYLFEQKQLEGYAYNKTRNILNEYINQPCDGLEAYLIEKSVGLNMSRKLAELLSEILKYSTQKDIQDKFHKEIKELVEAIAHYPGVYGRSIWIKKLMDIKYPKEVYDVNDMMEIVKNKLKYLTKLTNYFLSIAINDYSFFLGLFIGIYWGEDGKMVKEHVREEEALLKEKIKKMIWNNQNYDFICHEEKYSLDELSDSKQMYLYSVVQKYLVPFYHPYVFEL